MGALVAEYGVCYATPWSGVLVKITLFFVLSTFPNPIVKNMIALFKSLISYESKSQIVVWN